MSGDLFNGWPEDGEPVMSDRIKLSLRVRADCEAAPWVLEEIKKDEAEIERLKAQVLLCQEVNGNQYKMITNLRKAKKRLIQTCRRSVTREKKLLDALERLAKLGNEPHYGNSTGNTIAQKALAE